MKSVILEEALEPEGKGVKSRHLTLMNDSNVKCRDLTPFSSGSKTTITKLLRNWRSVQQEAAGALPRELLALVTGLWERLNQQTEQRLENYSLESRQEIKVLKEKSAQLQREQHVLQTQLHQQEEQTATLQATHHQLETQLLHEQQEHEKLRERHQSLILQLDESKAENKRLHQLAQQIQTNLEHYQAAVQQERTEQMQLLEKQQVSFQQEREGMQHQISAQRARLHALEKELQLKACEKRDYEALKSNYERCAEKQEALVQDYTILTERYGQLEKLSKQQAQTLESERFAQQELEKQCILVTERASVMEKSLHQAEDKIEALRQEKVESRRILETVR